MVKSLMQTEEKTSGLQSYDPAFMISVDLDIEE